MEETKRKEIEEQLRRLLMREDKLQPWKASESESKITPIRVIRRRRGAADVKIV